jgi:hypothetical protein
VLDYLAVVPEGLADAVDHALLSSLHLDDPEALLLELQRLSGPWRFRRLLLTS